MKNLLVNKSQTTAVSSNRQLIIYMAKMNKHNSAEDNLAKYSASEYDDQSIEIDEMQIDKLYQSL
jgi:hypothetical protein